MVIRWSEGDRQVVRRWSPGGWSPGYVVTSSSSQRPLVSLFPFRREPQKHCWKKSSSRGFKKTIKKNSGLLHPTLVSIGKIGVRCQNLNTTQRRIFFQLCTEEHAEATIVSGAVIVEVEGDSKEDWEKPGEDQESVEAVLVQPDGGTCAAVMVMVIVMGWDLWSGLPGNEPGQSPPRWRRRRQRVSGARGRGVCRQGWGSGSGSGGEPGEPSPAWRWRSRAGCRWQG